MGELIILWAARVAMLLYVAGIVGRLTGHWRLARAAWSVGSLALVVHVAAALAFVHHWDLDSAYAEVAQQTADTYGLDWGGGVYINFLFNAVWLADAGWWCLAPASYLARSRGWDLVVHGFMAFIVFNAVIVFPTGPIRWFGLAACVVLGTLAVVQRRSDPWRQIY